MFGRSPTLPVDVMLGRTQQEQCTQLSQYSFVWKLQQSVKAAFAEVRQKLVSAHQHQKQFADAHSKLRNEEIQFQVGDIVWLYTPAVKSGLSRKFSSFWRGPYTFIDRISMVNYRVQLIGSTKCLIVHSNRLKPYYGCPEKVEINLEPAKSTEKNCM